MGGLNTLTPLQGLPNLESAIAQNEGFGVTNSLAQQNNNPGNIESSGQLNTYSSLDAGWSALGSLITRIAGGNSALYPNGGNTTLGEFANTYTGGNANAASNIISSLDIGANPNTTLNQVLNTTPGTTVTPNQPIATETTTPDASGSTTYFGLNLTGWLTRGAAIAAGLILIAGAVFGLKAVQETVVTGAKAAVA